MKRILSFITVFALLLTACEGDPGPPGFDGLDGEDGGVFVAQSFERTIDLVTSNDYQETVVVPEDVEILESDMVLTYLFRGQVDDFDVWQLLPQIVYTDNGEQFQYNFEHNFDEVTIFIDAPSTFDFNNLLSGDTEGLTFRIVVLPVDFVNSNLIDVTNFNEVMNHIQ